MIERELEALRHRRELLTRQREVADGALSKALADRRRVLLESDLDKTGGEREPIRRLVERLRDEAESITDAIGSLDRQISETEDKLAQERDKGIRDRERQHRQEALDAARVVLGDFRAVSARMVEALAPLAGIGVMSAAAHTNLAYLAGELDKGIQASFAEVESYISMIVSGDAPIKIDPPMVAPVPPPAAIKRKAVFLRRAGRWQEGPEVITAGKHVTCSPPLAIALAAIEHGHAVDPESRVAQELRRLQDPDYAFQPAASCLDISRPMPAPAQPEIHASARPVHSGIAPPAGPYQGAMVGTAVATPVR
jgi:hypothetical protein